MQNSLACESVQSRGVEQLRNFAHFGDGARILPEVTSLTYGTRDNEWLYKEPSAHGLMHRTPPYVTSDEFMRIGDCWEFAGNRGTLSILLSEPTRITSIRLGNIHPELVSSASTEKSPRILRLWGTLRDDVVVLSHVEVQQAIDFSQKSAFNSKSYLKDNDRFALLLEIDYDPRAETFQSFSLARQQWSVEVEFHAVILEIVENWGGNRTCLYHFGVQRDLN